MSRRLSLGLVVAGFVLAGARLDAQDSGEALLASARKHVQEASGKKGTELETALKAAVEAFKQVVERFPDDVGPATKANLEMGRALKRLGRSADAEASFKRVLQHPEEAATACDALHELASLHRRAGKRADACAALQELIEKFPQQGADRAQALIRLAGLHRDAKDFAKAEACLRQCLEQHGDLWRQAVEALDDLVALKIRQKEIDEARRILESHSEAIRARFSGGTQEERVERALEKMPCRARLGQGEEKTPAGNGTPDDGPVARAA